MTVLVIYEVNKDSSYYAKLWYRSNKSRAHITVANGAGAPNDNFRENICSEDDLRSKIFGTFVVKISCFPASPRIFEHLKYGIIAYV